jgi:hypothetical protein
VDFEDHFFVGRDIFVPFDEGGYGAESVEGFAIDGPHVVDDGADVCVDDIVAVVCVACEVELSDAMDGDSLEIGIDIEVVVKGADVDIVDIKEDLAIGAFADLTQKVPFGHLAVWEGDVARDIFEKDLTSEGVLNLEDTGDDVTDRFFGVGKGQKIVAIVSAKSSPTQVIRDPCRLEAFFEQLECAEMIFGEWVGVADAKGNTVHHDGAMGANSVQNCPRSASGLKEILGDDFKPVDAVGRMLEQVVKMNRS